MKKIFALCIGTLLLWSCEKSDPKPDPVVVSFENITLNGDGIFRGSTPTGQTWLWNAGECTFAHNGLTLVTAVDERGSWAGIQVSKNASVDPRASGYIYDSYVFGSGGAEGTEKFLVIYDNSPNATQGLDKTLYYPYILLGNDTERKIEKLYINNNSYFYWYAKTGAGDFMGGAGFQSGDYFGVTITGYDKTGARTGSRDFVLADYRGGKSFICSDWTEVQLSSLGKVNKLTFNVFGTNIDMVPGYLCIDQIYYRPE